MYKLEVKCPNCKKYIYLEFSGIKWPKKETGDSFDHEDIKLNNLAWYECPKCNQKIRDNERPDLLQTQHWVCLNQEKPFSRVGFHKSVLFSPFETFSSIAAEFLSSKEIPQELQNFNNSWLAEPVEVGRKVLDETEIRNELSANYQFNEIPEGVKALTIGSDVGSSYLWWVVIGWGNYGEIWLISWGRVAVNNFTQDLNTLKLMQNKDFKGNNNIPIAAAAIDSGYRTPDVYDFCRKSGLWVPVKGSGSRVSAQWVINGADPTRKFGKKAFGLNLYSLHTEFFQDVLDGYLSRGNGEGAMFMHIPDDTENTNNNDLLIKHLSNEVKKTVYVNNRPVQKWSPRYRGAPQHIRDSIIYGIAIGHIKNLHKLKPVSQNSEVNPNIRRLSKNPRNSSRSSGFTTRR